MAEIVYELSRLRFPMIGQLRNTKTDPNGLVVNSSILFQLRKTSTVVVSVFFPLRSTKIFPAASYVRPPRARTVHLDLTHLPKS